MGGEPPTTPVMFLKPSTTRHRSERVRRASRQSAQVEFEGEIAVVIGRLAATSQPRGLQMSSSATPAQTMSPHATCSAVTVSGRVPRDSTRFCPLGPWIETEVDPEALAVETTVNGEVRQSAPASDMVHSIADLVVFVSSVMTLIPGDVILTGTPAGVGPLADGDRVSVSVAGVGRLDHLVRASD